MADELPSAPALDWPMRTGDTETLAIVVEGVDLSGRIYSSQVRATPIDDEPLATAECDVTYDGEDSTIVVTFSPESTRAIGDSGVDLAVYDVQEDVDGDGENIHTLLKGRVPVERDVTR